MLVLALDTATESVCAAVVDAATEEVLTREAHAGGAAHGEQLAPVVARALAGAGAQPGDLGLIGVGRGPGPFTGLRVGLAHAEVMGWALGIPVHGVCTLDVLAREAAAELGTEFLVATDARRREVYWARYGAAGDRLAGPAVGRAEDLAERSLPAVGAGAARYPEAFTDRHAPLHPDPAVLAVMAARMWAAGWPPDVTPLYLRRPDVTVSAQRKRVTPA